MRHLAVVGLSVVVVACGSEPKPSEPAAGGAASTPPAASQPMGGSPRVFFVEPKDGATVKSPVHLVFGIENYSLAAVPPGEVTTARPGMGHHHIGVDQDCLPAGTTIVKGTPSWVHFGDAKTEMDMQLPPGTHKLTLQLGDDLHNTMTNMCQTITVNVTE
jgi:hypothetical protein